MTDLDPDRPASRGPHTTPAPASPRPSVASRASRSSLRRELERHETPAHPRPTSAATYSRPHTPHAAGAAARVEESARGASPPPFTPVFALLSSTSHATNRQTVHHPTVHYIFADDDPEMLTAALARHHRGSGGVYADDDEGVGVASTTLDRGVLLDMEPTADGSGYEVAWASSLTPDWAATSATISRSEGGLGGAAPGLASQLVLKIEGVSLEQLPSRPPGKTPTPEAEMHSSGGSTGKGRTAPAAEDYADLLQDFEKRMSTLRKVVEAGAARQRAVGDGTGQFSEAARDRVPTSGESAQDREGRP